MDIDKAISISKAENLERDNSVFRNALNFWMTKALNSTLALQAQQRGINRLRRRIGSLEARAMELQHFAVDNPTLTYKEVVTLVEEHRWSLAKERIRDREGMVGFRQHVGDEVAL